MTTNPDHLFLLKVQAEFLENVAADTSPLAAYFGTRVLKISDGEIRLGFTVPEVFFQGGGVIQGGAQSVMLDFGLAWAALARLGPDRTVASIGMNVHFLRPAYGNVFTVVGRVERIGNTVATATADLFAEDTKVATASSSLAVIKLPIQNRLE